MNLSAATPLATLLAERLRQSREELTSRWLERIVARVTLVPNRVFPSEELLDHVPLLVDGIAAYIENPTDDVIADVAVIAKARELGAMRHEQGFSAYEILKEHELLGSVLFSFLTREVANLETSAPRAELLVCAHRLFRALEVIRQATTSHFLERMAAKVREREDQLGAFNRMVSHQLKNRLGAILGACAMLHESWLDESAREKFLRMVGTNAEGIRSVLDDLETLSRLDHDRRQERNVLLPGAAAEAVRQLRDYARSRGVSVRLCAMPPVEVNAAAVELCLANYLSNAVKYSDPNEPERWVEVSARLVEDGARFPCELVVSVTDNGLGVPEPARARLFERFYRAHETLAGNIDGTGLGLSIVRETVEPAGGRAWAEFPEKGSRFCFSLPCRRELDKS